MPCLQPIISLQSSYCDRQRNSPWFFVKVQPSTRVFAMAFCSRAATKPDSAWLPVKVQFRTVDVWPLFCAIAPASPALVPSMNLWLGRHVSVIVTPSDEHLAAVLHHCGGRGFHFWFVNCATAPALPALWPPGSRAKILPSVPAPCSLCIKEITGWKTPPFAGKSAAALAAAIRQQHS